MILVRAADCDFKLPVPALNQQTSEKAMNTKQNQVERHLKEMEKHSRKQKLRDASRKAGPKHTTKKPRQKKLSHLDWEEIDDLELETYAPIISKSARERRKEVEKQAIKAKPVPEPKTENMGQEVHNDQWIGPAVWLLRQVRGCAGWTSRGKHYCAKSGA